MSTDDRIRKRRSVRNPLVILGLTMTIIYVSLGALLLLRKSFLPDLPPDFRNIFAGMLLVYGLYRGWRVYADNFQ